MTMIVDVVNYFEEIDIPFCFLCIIFLVKINVTCGAIFLKPYLRCSLKCIFLELKNKIEFWCELTIAILIW